LKKPFLVECQNLPIGKIIVREAAARRQRRHQNNLELTDQ